MFDELLKLIEEHWPDQKPYRMSFVHKVGWEIELGDAMWDITG